MRRRIEARGEAKAIVLVLEARSVPVSEETRERIMGCDDRESLECWLRRAAVVDDVDLMFAE